jgi:hypothetical protein
MRLPVEVLLDLHVAERHLGDTGRDRVAGQPEPLRELVCGVYRTTPVLPLSARGSSTTG